LKKLPRTNKHTALDIYLRQRQRKKLKTLTPGSLAQGPGLVVERDKVAKIHFSRCKKRSETQAVGARRFDDAIDDDVVLTFRVDFSDASEGETPAGTTVRISVQLPQRILSGLIFTWLGLRLLRQCYNCPSIFCIQLLFRSFRT